MKTIQEHSLLANDGVRGKVHAIHYHLSYQTQGHIDTAQPVIVLLHDFPGSSEDWKTILPHIKKYPVMAFDMLGFGESDRPWPADTSIWGHADALHSALRELGLQKVIFVGIGLGGGVAQTLAARLAADITVGLVLINSAAFQHSFSPNWPLSNMQKIYEDPEAVFHLTTEQVTQDLRAVVPNGSSQAASVSGGVLDSIVSQFTSDTGKAILLQQINRLTPYYLNAVAFDLKFISRPTAIIWGEKNTVFPLSLGLQLHSQIPNSTFEVIPNAGQLILLDAPQAVAAGLAVITSKI